MTSKMTSKTTSETTSKMTSKTTSEMTSKMTSETKPLDAFALLSKELNASPSTEKTVIKSTKKYKLFLNTISKKNGDLSIRKLGKLKKDFMELPIKKQKRIIKDLWQLQTGDIVNFSDIKQHQGLNIPVWLIEVLEGRRCMYGKICRDKHKRSHLKQFKLH